MIQFLLNQQQVELQDFAADLTVLDYLRNRRQMYGTKEGCASGDCGACTVVIATPSDDGLAYQSINSCITFVGSLHGKQLITIEHLTEEGKLHPVQQAMVEHHGSQCGFCTPGFVMSMFSMYKNQTVENNREKSTVLKSEIANHLGGNLCRCTGYRPIIDAASCAISDVKTDCFSLQEVATRKHLLEIEEFNTESAESTVHLPKSLAELTQCLVKHPEARLVAGSTDIALEVTQQLKQFPRIIFLEKVLELQSSRQHADSLEIGAATSLSRCQQLIAEHYPQTDELFDRFGSRQIRNQGTIGGNIANASPIGDLPPMLIALNATLMLQCGASSRKLAIEEFFLDYRETALQPGEFIRSIRVPLPTPEQVFRIYKVSKRLEDDISAVCMAIAITRSGNAPDQIESARIALGGMAAIPKRASQAEAALVGQTLEKASFIAAGKNIPADFQPLSDARASAAYRTQVAENLLKRFYLEATQQPIATRLPDHD